MRTSSLRLGTNEVQVWCADLDAWGANLKTLGGFLSSEELELASRFKIAVDRDRFLAGRAALREMLGSYLERPSSSPFMEIAPRGKPRISRSLGSIDLRFNLSHSYGLALFAFSLGREVGVDIEKIRPEFISRGIAELYFSSREQEDLDNTPNDLRPEAFFRCWTRKEAYVKARGDGFNIPLDSFSVSLKPNAPAMLSSPHCGSWGLYSLNTPPGFAGALVVEGSQCKVIYRDW